VKNEFYKRPLKGLSQPAIQEQTASILYELPAYSKYVVSIPVPGYDEPFFVALGVPPKRGNKSIDKEQALLPVDRSAREFEQENRAFEQLLPELLGTKSGQFVAVFDGRVIDCDGDEFSLAARVERSHRGAFVLIRKVVPVQVAGDYLESPEWETE